MARWFRRQQQHQVDVPLEALGLSADPSPQLGLPPEFAAAPPRELTPAIYGFARAELVNAERVYTTAGGHLMDHLWAVDDEFGVACTRVYRVYGPPVEDHGNVLLWRWKEGGGLSGRVHLAVTATQTVIVHQYPPATPRIDSSRFPEWTRCTLSIGTFVEPGSGRL